MAGPKPTCPCGRSPTGKCIGWHALTELQYKKKLEEWKNTDGNKERKTNTPG